MGELHQSNSCVLFDSASDYFGFGKCFPGGTTPQTRAEPCVGNILCMHVVNTHKAICEPA